MNKKVVVIFVCFVILIGVGFAALYIAESRCTEIVFEYSECSYPVNPSKGLYVQVDSGDLERVEKYCDDVELFLVAYNLYDYRDRELTDEKLAELEECFSYISGKGDKIIFRAAYGFEDTEDNDAQSRDLIDAHIKQFAPIINKYMADVICVQAGLYGPWGEWHGSVYLDDDNACENRNWLIGKLISNIDKTIPIALRRPRFIRDAVQDGISVERLAYFDDGLLGSDTDLGTYDDLEYDREKELSWINENLKINPMGGEMVKVCDYSKAQNADREFDMLNISYLNMKYNEEVYEQWKNEQIDGENAYDYIVGRLGYLLRVENIVYPRKIEGILPIDKSVSVSIVNDGYGSVPSFYQLEWIVETEEGKRFNFVDDKVDLSSIQTGDTLTAIMPLKNTEGYTIKRLGIRISEKGIEGVAVRKCIQFSNDSIEFKNGINYFGVNGKNRS